VLCYQQVKDSVKNKELIQMERLDKSKNSSQKLENQNLLTSEVAKLRHLWRGKHQGDCFDKFCESL